MTRSVSRSAAGEPANLLWILIALVSLNLASCGGGGGGSGGNNATDASINIYESPVVVERYTGGDSGSEIYHATLISNWWLPLFILLNSSSPN